MRFAGGEQFDRRDWRRRDCGGVGRRRRDYALSYAYTVRRHGQHFGECNATSGE